MTQDLAQFAQFCASFNENPIDEVNSLTIDRNILIVFQIPKYSRPQKLMFIYTQIKLTFIACLLIVLQTITQNMTKCTVYTFLQGVGPCKFNAFKISF